MAEHVDGEFDERATVSQKYSVQLGEAGWAGVQKQALEEKAADI